MNQTKRNWLAALFATLAAVLLAAALCFALPFSDRRASGAIGLGGIPSASAGRQQAEPHRRSDGYIQHFFHADSSIGVSFIACNSLYKICYFPGKRKFANDTKVTKIYKIIPMSVITSPLLTTPYLSSLDL